MSANAKRVDEINWSHVDRIAVPVDSIHMIIRKQDWDRLKRELRSAKPHRDWLSRLWPSLFGVGVTLAFSIIPLSNGTSLPTWVLPVYCMASAGFLICAAVFYFVDRSSRSRRAACLNSIIEDMAEIEKEFPRFMKHRE